MLPSTISQARLCNAFITHDSFDPDFIASILSKSKENEFLQVVLDTGSSFAISPNRDDFSTYHPVDSLLVQTAGGPTSIVGYGLVEWTLMSENGFLVPLTIPCRHVPASKMRLLSTQDLIQFLGLASNRNQFGGNSEYFWMNGSANPKHRFICQVDPKSNLPMALVKSSKLQKFKPNQNTSCTRCHRCQSHLVTSTLNVVHEANANITTGHKELLLWHYRLVQLSFQHIQWLMRPRDKHSPLSKEKKTIQCIHPRVDNTSSCEPPLCG